MLYLCSILFVTLLTRNANLISSIRIIPLWSYREWFRGRLDYGKSICLNIALFIPMGYLLFDLLKDYTIRKARFLTLLICTLLSTMIEGVQYYTGLGLCDIDDIINNCAGTLVGIALYQVVENYLSDKRSTIHAVFLFIGLIGCVMAFSRSNSGSIEKYALQFDFEINRIEIKGDEINLTGICYIYGRNTPEYHIVLKDTAAGKDCEIERAFNERNFNVTAQIDPSKEYEVDVYFHGYKPINTMIYIDCGVKKYVEGKVETPSIQNPIFDYLTQAGILKAYNPELSTYIYQVNNSVYWMVGSIIEPSTEIVFQIHTDEPEKLPENRRKYGFDNRCFYLESADEQKPIDGFRVFKAEIPSTYHVTAVMVGFSIDGKLLWSKYFRP